MTPSDITAVRRCLVLKNNILSFVTVHSSTILSFRMAFSFHTKMALSIHCCTTFFLFHDDTVSDP
jgi:hypothetical protein